MRRLVCAVTLSMGMLMGCGGPAEEETPGELDTVEQGLACAYPDFTCPPGSYCRMIRPDEGICRPL